jgi:predicted MPP superfamily phosphohydrolase
MLPTERERSLRRKIGLASGLILVALALWGFWIEPASLRITRHTIEPPGWPPELHLRIALLADLHVGSPGNGPDKLRRIVDRTNALHPDLILLLGDYVTKGVFGGTFVPPETTEEILRDLQAPLGVFAVLGNHDYAMNARRITRALERAGIRVLADEAARVPGPGRSGPPPFWIVGVTDLLRGPHDLQGALRQVTDDAPVLLITHNPDLFPEVPDRVALTLAAHTHGGQVYLPLIGRPIVPSRYGERYAAGHIVERGRHLFVSVGLGTSILPVRFLVPPEIALLDVEGRP